MLHITQAKYLKDYQVVVTINDGQQGLADLAPALAKVSFQSLQDDALFSQVQVEPELATFVWPIGLDLAPEFAYLAVFKNAPQLQSQFKAWGYLD